MTKASGYAGESLSTQAKCKNDMHVVRELMFTIYVSIYAANIRVEVYIIVFFILKHKTFVCEHNTSVKG